MTIDGMIEIFRSGRRWSISVDDCYQLADWLEELREFRNEKDEIRRYKEENNEGICRIYSR